MKKVHLLVFNIALVALLITILFSCNDPTTVGAGILDNDVIPIQVDELDVSFRQNEGTPFTAYTGGGASEQNQVQCGIIEDDVFGRSEASFYMQFHPLTRLLVNKPDRIIDSVYLVLYLDSAATYGKNGFLTLGIDRLTESIDGLQSYLSNHNFGSGESLVSDFLFQPNYEMPDEDEIEPGANVRIPLSESIGTEIFALDSLILNSDSAFLQNFFGIHIKPIASSQQFVGFNPYRSNDQSVLSGIRIYYRDSATDTSSVIYNLSSSFGYFRSPVVQHYDFDYTGSQVEHFLNNPTDSILFIQGNGGVNVEVIIDGLADLGSILINKAELFIPFNSSALDFDDFPELETIFLTREGLSGNREFIPEFLESVIFRFTPMGRLDSLDSVLGYSYNIPIQIQEMIDQTIFGEDMRLQSVGVSSDQNRRTSFGPENKAESSARSVIFGRTNLSETIRLRISYTDN